MPGPYIPVCLSPEYILVYNVRMKNVRIAHRVNAKLMAIGIRNSHRICIDELFSQRKFMVLR
jgi:hypothetical protein